MPFNSGDGKLPFARSTTARLPFGNDDNLPIPFNLSRSIIHLLPGGAFSGSGGRTTQNVVQPGFEVALTQEALANGTFDITITVTGTNGATVDGFSYTTDFFVSSSSVTGTVGVKTINLPGVYNFFVGATDSNGNTLLVNGGASIATAVTVTAVSNQYRIKTNETTPNYITSSGGVSTTVADGAVFEKLDPLFISSGAFFPNKSYRIKDTTNYLVSNTPAIEAFTDTTAWKERATWQEQAYSGDIMLYDVTGAPSYLYVNSGALDTAESQTGQVPNPPPGEYRWDFEPFQEANRLVVQNIAQAANQTVSFDIVLTTALVQTDVLFKLKTGTYGVPKRFTQQASTLPTASVLNGEYMYTFSFTDISGAYEVRCELSNGAVVVNSFNLPVYETQPTVPTISPPTSVSADTPASGTGVVIAIGNPSNGIIDIWQGQQGDTLPDLYNPVGVQTAPSFVESETVIDSPEEVLITITEDKLYANPYFIIIPRNARRAVATPLEVAVPSSGPTTYRYIGFYGSTSASSGAQSGPVISELAFITSSGTFKSGTAYEIAPLSYTSTRDPQFQGYSALNGLFDSSYTYTPPILQFESIGTGMYFYVDLGASNTNTVTSIVYTPATDLGTHFQFTNIKAYGTNTNPSTFTTVGDVSNWTLIDDSVPTQWIFPSSGLISGSSYNYHYGFVYDSNKGSSDDVYVYRLHYSNNTVNGSGDQDIKYTVSTQTWADAGSQNPTSVTSTANPTTVTLGYGGGTYAVFTNPYYS
jgi:hypothetical protein